MKTSHLWFSSGHYSLLAHIDAPKTTSGSLGALIVPPFGWEDVCSYRPLRFLAHHLAANNIPTLRFDLPGTGDSSGSLLDFGLVDAWIQAIGDAAAVLRAATGVERVAVIGIRLGAMLALTAAVRGANLQDLILWGPSATGRALLRELHAVSSLERSMDAKEITPRPQPMPGLEVAGFLLTPELQSDLAALNLSSLPRMEGRRILVLSRDNLPPDATLVSALKGAGCAIEVKTGSGYTTMMAAPHEVIPPTETSRAITDFLSSSFPGKRSSAADSLTRQTNSTRSAMVQLSESLVQGSESIGVRESISTLNCSSSSLFAILSEPRQEVQRTGWCLLLLNAGAIRHIGPNRMWVGMARRWAARGVPSLRIDFGKVGESEGDSELSVAGLYQDQVAEQVETAIDAMRSKIGAQRFTAIGLCSGAFGAFQAALRNPAIRGAILLNPKLFFWDPEVDRRREMRRILNGLSDTADWRRLARREIQPDRIRRAVHAVFNRISTVRSKDRKQLQIPKEAMAQAWSTLERFQTRLTFIFGQGEPLLLEMEEEGHLPPENNPRIRCIRIDSNDHILRPLWAQMLAQELIDGELETIFHETQPIPTI